MGERGSLGEEVKFLGVLGGESFLVNLAHCKKKFAMMDRSELQHWGHASGLNIVIAILFESEGLSSGFFSLRYNQRWVKL